MGIIGRFLKVAKEDKFNVVTAETRKGFDEEALLYASAGDDSVPCDNDRLILIKAGNTGEKAAVGSLNESQGAKPGEKILYSRDKNGKVVATIKMLNSGNIEIELKGDCKIKTEGNIELNGSDFGGLIKIEELKMQLQKNMAILNGILGTLKAPIPEPGNGAPSAFQAALITAIGTMQTGDFSNIENKKVKHGGG
ncbi:hypothetical protein [Treponema denticola]|uniref:Phage baseplate assembly protein V n=1 Tax=Treponema denticola OTK TaxID=999434 RepID=A0A0F6MR28_TREDN|nr:hypothetical protein [Treponema denticola]EMB23321.1 hypothetical protein HMPREF9723_00459 [Treponema denticola OTK]